LGHHGAILCHCITIDTGYTHPATIGDYLANSRAQRGYCTTSLFRNLGAVGHGEHPCHQEQSGIGACRAATEFGHADTNGGLTTSPLRVERYIAASAEFFVGRGKMRSVVQFLAQIPTWKVLTELERVRRSRGGKCVGSTLGQQSAGFMMHAEI